MKRLRWSMAAVLLALTFVFNVERIDLDEANVVDISSFVYVLGFLVVTSPILSRRSPSNAKWAGAVAAFWVAVYLAAKLFVFRRHPAWGGIHTYVTFTELAIVLVLSLLTSTLAQGLREFEEAVAALTLTDVSRKVRSVEDARTDIDDRMLLSRRHQRPLSVLVFGLDREASATAVHRIVEEVQRGMANRYVVATLANAIVRNLRRTDLPLEQGGDGRFVVLCPETDASGAALAARHVQKALLADMGVQMRAGTATFPGDALTFEELLRHAETRVDVVVPAHPLTVSTSDV